MYEIRWHGRGGQGSFTGAKLLGTAAAIYDNRFAQAFPSFGPERRGAPVLGFNRIANQPINDRSEIEQCDTIIILDDTLMSDSYLEDLKENAKILLNSTKEYFNKKIISIDATSLAQKILGKPITNTAMLGLFAALNKDIVTHNACIMAINSSIKNAIAQMNIELFIAAYKIGEDITNEKF
ncbi:MAG: 2-oxoacid:acceptor oxidoreductase family protein [Clostridia bacterium]